MKGRDPCADGCPERGVCTSEEPHHEKYYEWGFLHSLGEQMRGFHLILEQTQILRTENKNFFVLDKYCYNNQFISLFRFSEFTTKCYLSLLISNANTVYRTR
jgi:hypothetical protein